MADQSSPLPKSPSAAPGKPAAAGDTSASDVKLPDPVELSRIMTRIAEHSQRLVAHLPTMAVWAVEDAVPPPLAQPLDFGQIVHYAERQH